MKKTFPLHLPGKQDSWVLASLLVTLHKYVKRERRKEFPEGMDWWEFHCRVGTTPETAQSCALSDFPKAVEAVAQTDHPDVYVEIVAVAGHKPKRANGRPIQPVTP